MMGTYSASLWIRIPNTDPGPQLKIGQQISTSMNRFNTKLSSRTIIFVCFFKDVFSKKII